MALYIVTAVIKSALYSETCIHKTHNVYKGIKNKIISVPINYVKRRRKIIVLIYFILLYSVSRPNIQFVKVDACGLHDLR